MKKTDKIKFAKAEAAIFLLTLMALLAEFKFGHTINGIILLAVVFIAWFFYKKW